MNTLELHSSISNSISSISTALGALEHSFKTIAPRNQVDEMLIDTLSAQAQQLIVKAAQLKQVQFIQV